MRVVAPLARRPVIHFKGKKVRQIAQLQSAAHMLVYRWIAVRIRVERRKITFNLITSVGFAAR
jgi:hypothetical protein